MSIIMDGYDFLAQDRIQSITETLADERNYPATLRYLTRTKVKPALDSELFATTRPRVVIADIIGKNDKAPMRTRGAVQIQRHDLPVSKHGQKFDREELRLMRRVANGLGNRTDASMLRTKVTDHMADLVQGVRLSMNWMVARMLQDDFAWDKNGVIFNATFGMPSDLKITLTGGDRWSEPTTATPVADIHGLQRTARIKYGITLDRLTLSQQAFDYMVATDEFQKLAFTLMQMGGPTSNVLLPLTNNDMMIPLAQRVIGNGLKSIEIDDDTFAEEHNDGTITDNRYLAENRVILDSAANDGSGNWHDLANAEVDEAYEEMVPSMIGEPVGGPFGPFGFVTASDPEGNPPGMKAWAVGIFFPRKHRAASSARLTVY